MENILYLFLAFYFLFHLTLLVGIVLNTRKPAESSYRPFVSVIVAARNEQEYIGNCIESLLKLDYPHDKLEILLVNDRSTDSTRDIMLKYAEKNPVLKYIEIENVEGKLKGKTNALSVAVRQAKGEIIFTTDADITIKPTWVGEMVKYYDDQTGVVSSFSTIQPKNINWGMQSFDWFYLLGLAAGGDGIGFPMSCLGNNMSYRKSAYDAVGGYENIKFSVTEDFMLLHTIRNKTKMKTSFPVDTNVMNATFPCKNIREIYRQKKRWGRGGLDSASASILAGGVAWLSAFCMAFGIFAGFIPYLTFVVGKALVDCLFILPMVREFRMWKVYLYLIPFEIYFTVYILLSPFIIFVGKKVVWKEQKL